MSDRRWFKVCCDVETIEKLDSLPGESRSQKVRDLIDDAWAAEQIWETASESEMLPRGLRNLLS